MTQVNKGLQIVGISSTYDMTERKSASKNSATQVITYGDISDTIKAEMVPYESVYRALLYQSGGGDVDDRILNYRDGAYLDIGGGDVPGLFINRTDVGVYSTALPVFEDIDMSLVTITPMYMRTALGSIYVSVANDALVIETFDTDDVASDGILTGMPFEIRMRERGDSFQAVSAFVNSFGNELSIEVNKTLGTYGFDSDTITDAFLIEVADVAIENTLVTRASDNLIVVSFSADPALTSESEIKISFDASVNVEAYDLGLLDAFDDLSVTNNIPEVEEE